MRFALALAFIACMMSCAAPTPKEGLDAVKDAFDKNPNDETYSGLFNLCMETLRDQESPDRKKSMLLGAEASKTMKKWGQAIGFLNAYIKDFPQAADIPDKTFELGELLERTNKNEAAITVFQGLLANSPNHSKAAEAKKIVGDVPSVAARLDVLGQQMFEDDKGQLNVEAARSFVDACEAYALTSPKADDAADFLHKAAETARAMRTIPKALSLYDWILEKYPDHAKAPQALFLKAFTFDNNLKDVANARKYYEEFLSKYPNDDFADDTQFLLENLGKSDEEILEALTKKGEK